MSNEVLESTIEDALRRIKEGKADIDRKVREFEDMQAKALRPSLKSQSEGEDEEESKEYRKAFNTFLRKGNTRVFEQFEGKAMSTTTGTDGGYAVPKQIDTMIENLLVTLSPIRSIAKVIQIGTSDYHKLINIKGTASGWVAETAARPATNTPQLADLVITPGELYANPQVTQRMLDDAFFDVESWLAGEVAEEFSRAEGAAFIVGDGSNKPYGILNTTPVATADSSRALGTPMYLPSGNATGFVAASTSASQADILLAMIMSLKQGYRQNGRWLMSSATLSTVSQFKDSAGRFVFAPQVAPGVPQNLWGYPIAIAEDMPSIGAGNFPIAFGDFSKFYEIVDRKGISVLPDPYSNKPWTGMYSVKRVGARVVNSEAVRFLKIGTS